MSIKFNSGLVKLQYRVQTEMPYKENSESLVVIKTL